MTTEKARLTRETMAARLAAEFQDGWIVNLGVGMPLMCSDYMPADRSVILHAENGVIGYGPRATEEQFSPHLTNAGGQCVVLQPYAAFTHHADAFALVRKGMINAAVLGAYEVGANGDLANWRVANQKGGGIGGAMDIAACAQQVFALLEHTIPRTGEPRLLSRCNLPLTAPGCVTLVMTDLGLFEAAGDGFRVRELAPGFTVDEVQALTGAPLYVEGTIKEVRI